MIKIVLIALALMIAGVLMFAATKPDDFHVERSAVIRAPAEKVFVLINDFKKWETWSPWEKKDPSMKRSFGATTMGKGASYAWEGNGDVGQGSMEIFEAIAPTRIRLKLDFIKPFEAHNVVTFTLTPRGDSTTVSWAMEGPTPYFAKVIHVFINMDAMVGKDFEAGLASLKSLAEK